MSSLNPFDFESMIADDILYLIISHCSIKQIQPLMEVNRRWNDVCFHHLMIKTKFDVDDLQDYFLNDGHRIKHFKRSQRLLEVMPAIRSFKFNFSRINPEDWSDLIVTMANHNPFIEELILNRVNEEILTEMIKRVGSKIKTFYLYDSDLKTGIKSSLFKGVPLEDLKVCNCPIEPKIFESIPSTLRRMSFIEFNNEDMTYAVIEALIRSSHASSIEYLKFNHMYSREFDLICENFKSLESFDLNFKASFDLQNVKKLTNLKRLGLGCFSVENLFGNSLISNTQNLKYLKLFRCKFDFYHLKLLTELSPDLEHLSLVESYEGIFGFQEFKVLCRLTKLKRLYLGKLQIDLKYIRKYHKHFKMKI